MNKILQIIHDRFARVYVCFECNFIYRVYLGKSHICPECESQGEIVYPECWKEYNGKECKGVLRTGRCSECFTTIPPSELSIFLVTFKRTSRILPRRAIYDGPYTDFYKTWRFIPGVDIIKRMRVYYR